MRGKNLLWLRQYGINGFYDNLTKETVDKTANGYILTKDITFFASRFL